MTINPGGGAATVEYDHVTKAYDRAALAKGAGAVNDLSLSGFSATSVSRLHVGTVCWLTLPGLEALQAEVIWWEDSMCGCAFAQLLSPIVHDNILARYRGE